MLTIVAFTIPCLGFLALGYAMHTGRGLLSRSRLRATTSGATCWVPTPRWSTSLSGGPDDRRP